jgi:hypothetical protein
MKVVGFADNGKKRESDCKPAPRIHVIDEEVKEGRSKLTRM